MNNLYIEVGAFRSYSALASEEKVLVLARDKDAETHFHFDSPESLLTSIRNEEELLHYVIDRTPSFQHFAYGTNASGAPYVEGGFLQIVGFSGVQNEVTSLPRIMELREIGAYALRQFEALGFSKSESKDMITLSLSVALKKGIPGKHVTLKLIFDFKALTFEAGISVGRWSDDSVSADCTGYDDAVLGRDALDIHGDLKEAIESAADDIPNKINEHIEQDPKAYAQVMDAAKKVSKLLTPPHLKG